LRREAGGEEGGGGGEYLGEGSGRCFCWASSLLVGDPFTFRSFKCCIICVRFHFIMVWLDLDTPYTNYLSLLT
jgi:hypothetical protein